ASYPWYPAPADEGDTWARGTNTQALKALCDYWVKDYDWRASEAVLNRYPQFIETIDGIDVHYVHVEGEGPAARPIILTHGWPGSHYEFWDVIERLAYPSKFGGDPKDAFHVVVPSLPGFGFSGKPEKPIGPRTTARLWNTLMTQSLGYSRYLAQGGDLGALVTPFVGLDHDACVAVHLNMIAVQPADFTPQSDEEATWLTTNEAKRPIEGAYLQQHTTKPQTIALALADSPVGTASWILEKIRGWTDLRSGDLYEVYSKDEILTSIMIYLVNDAISSSIWFYRGFVEEAALMLQPGQRLTKPTGVANFTGEPVFNNPPRSWAERMFDVVHWSDIDQGGHFAAMEQPELFANDVITFARSISY
ncbi:MAG: epoxide hydrolase family protein, partial [Pseudomonadota bacterium]